MDLKKQMAATLYRAVDMIARYPDGLETETILRWLERGEDDTSMASASDYSIHRDFHFGVIGPRNAGWLERSADNRWRLTPLGRAAFGATDSPQLFFRTSGRHSLRGWIATRFPRSLIFASRGLQQLAVEIRMIRRLGLRRLMRELRPGSAGWEKALPVQSARVLEVSGVSCRTPGELLQHFASCQVISGGGGHTLYLSPAAWSRTGFAAIQSEFPPGSGLKISRNPGRLQDTAYINSDMRGLSTLHKMVTYDHRHQLLVSNLLYMEGLGPRPVDLIELNTGGQYWIASVVEHVEGRMPTDEETREGLERLRALERRQLLKVSMPDGYNDEDFRIPDCNGNALCGPKGWLYLDHQNFLLVDYQRFLRKVAIESADDSHFGDRALVRGGHYLYQAVPGLSLAARREPSRRSAQIQRLLAEHGLGVDGRLVLDIGCNVGMMMAQYLRLGASWSLGWDLPEVTARGERLMRTIGCTRFAFAGRDVLRDGNLEDDVPAFLKPQLPGCIVSYLAVHRWLGWLPALGRIPWSVLIFEGHEHDSEQFNRESLRQLQKITPCEIVAYEMGQDGDSDPRAVAIIVRKN